MEGEEGRGRERVKKEGEGRSEGQTCFVHT